MDKMNGIEDEKNKTEDWLREQYIDEARRIEKEVLEKDDVLTDDEIDVDASFERLMMKMKARGIYPGEEPKEKAKSHETIVHMHEAAAKISAEMPEMAKTVPDVFDEPAKSNKKVSMRRRKTDKGIYRFMSCFSKVATVVLVAGICVFGVTMTSEANRNYVIDSFKILVGNDVQVNVANSEERDRSSVDEAEAVRKIEDTMNVSVPNFLYRPMQFAFDSYYLDKISSVANIHYLYKNKWVISLSIIRSKDDASSSINFHGEMVGTVSAMSKDDIKVDIYKVKEPTDKKASYIAKWNIEEVYYQLSGKLEEVEIRRMLEQMEG